MHFFLQDTIHLEPASILSEVPTTKSTTRNRLPESTGDNKYTEKMVPGYTGQPQYMYHKHLNTLRFQGDNSSNQFITGNYLCTPKDSDLLGLQRWPTIGNPVISMKDVEN